MATQKYGKLARAEMQGGMLIQQGSAKFLKKAKTVSIATEIRTVRFFDAKFTRPRTLKTASGCILYCSGTVASKRLIVSRATLGGTMSGATFWYSIVGF